MLGHGEFEDNSGIEACSLASLWKFIIAFIVAVLVLSYFMAG